MVHSRPLTMVWIYSHLTARCLLLVLLPVLRTIFKCVSWIAFFVAALAASRWINWFLRSCCVPMIDVLDEAPANSLDLDSLWPGWGGCVSVICWWGIEEEHASATTIVSVRNTLVFRTALEETRTLRGRMTRYWSPRQWVALHTYFFTLWWRLLTIRRTRVLHSLQELLFCWSRLHNTWRC